jgi:hypothetical protein
MNGNTTDRCAPASTVRREKYLYAIVHADTEQQENQGFPREKTMTNPLKPRLSFEEKP